MATQLRAATRRIRDRVQSANDVIRRRLESLPDFASWDAVVSDDPDCKKALAYAAIANAGRLSSARSAMHVPAFDRRNDQFATEPAQLSRNAHTCARAIS